MAKIKNKIASKKNKQNANNTEQLKFDSFIQQKHDMQQAMAKQDYADAMDIMAEIVTAKRVDAEIMYWAAICYFYTEDYERAAKWISNAMNYVQSSQSVLRQQIMIMLGRICFMENREKEGLQILEQALQSGTEKLDETAKDSLADVLFGYRIAKDDSLAGYPRLKRYLELEDEEVSCQPRTETLPAGNESVELPEVKEDAAKRLDEEKGSSEAGDVVAKLKALLARTKQENSKNEEPRVENGIDTKPKANKTEEIIQLEEKKSATDSADRCVIDAAAIKTQIMAKTVSLSEKIKLLNAFAASCYQADDYVGAKLLLQAALSIDGQDNATLKNMAYTYLATDEKEAALSYAARMQPVDFGLLYLLK